MGTDSTGQPEPCLRVAQIGPRLLLFKALLLGGLALAGALLARIPALHEWLTPAGRLVPRLNQLGGSAMPIFTVGSALLIAIGVPRLIFCPLAGAVFGFWSGLLISTVATMLAYQVMFLFIRGRSGNRDAPFVPPPQLAFLRHDPGLAGVIVARLVPLPGMLATIALSLSPVSPRTYMIGSLIGLIPEAVPLVLFGAGLLEGNPRQLAWLGAAALLLVLAAYFLMRHFLRRSGHPPRRS